MPSRGSIAYRKRKNRKKAIRRREKRRKIELAPIFDPARLGMLAVLFTPEQCFHLHNAGTPLNRIKRVIRDVEYLQCAMTRLASPRDIDAEVLDAPHDHRSPKLSNRPMKLNLNPKLQMPAAMHKIAAFSDAVISRSLAGFHECPMHPGAGSMRVFPASDGSDFYYRCHLCGTCLKSLELLKHADRIAGENWPSLARFALEHGIVTERIKEQTIRVFEWVERWQNVLDAGRQYYHQRVKAGIIRARFGDWALLPSQVLEEIIKEMRPVSGSLRELHLVRVLRNLFGYVSGVVVYQPQGIIPWLDVRFTNDSLLLDCPRWADFRDWGEEMVICSDSETAASVERAVAGWVPSERVAVAAIAGKGGLPGLYRPPYAQLWLAVRSEAQAAFGLKLQHAGAATRMSRLPAVSEGGVLPLIKSYLFDERSPTYLTYLAETLVADSRPLHSLLSTVLADRDIPFATGRELVELVAQRAKIPCAELLRDIEAQSNPFAIQLGKSIFACRGGKYVKSVGKDRDFAPISNFSVRIEGTRPGPPGNPTLDLRLTVDSRAASLSLTDNAFRDSKKLWRAIRACAEADGMEAPMMYTVPDRKLLPEIIRGTHWS